MNSSGRRSADRRPATSRCTIAPTMTITAAIATAWLILALTWLPVGRTQIQPGPRGADSLNRSMLDDPRTGPTLDQSPPRTSVRSFVVSLGDHCTRPALEQNFRPVRGSH